MKRTYILLVGVLAGAASASTVASAHDGAPRAHPARAAKVQLRKTSLGKVLVDASGFTLYMFTRDTRNKNTCVKIRGCPQVWRALSTSGNPSAGLGVKASLLSTIKLSGGTKQVTYAGRPLYTYTPASEPAETSYVGAVQFGGAWDAVNATGNIVK